MANPHALVITPSCEGWFLPSLLHQAGWVCSVVSLSPIYRLSDYVQHSHQIANANELIKTAMEVQTFQGGFDWVIAASDEVLAACRNRALLDPSAHSLLPITEKRGSNHLASKVNLSRTLDRYGINTPAWGVARSTEEALDQAGAIGYPCMLKRDYSNSGRGTFLCKDPQDLQQAASRLSRNPFLVQKAMIGRLWSIEALYWRNELRGLAASTIERTISQFGPSLTRSYAKNTEHLASLKRLTQDLGHALAANGWANISCIQTAKNQWCCIEADLRPNSWLALDANLGGGFATAIKSLPEQHVQEPVFCYSKSEAAREPVIHPQRLIQIGANEEDIQAAWPRMPNESPQFLQALREQKFIPWIHAA